MKDRMATILGTINRVKMLDTTPSAFEIVGNGTSISVGVSSEGVELFSMPCTMTRDQAKRLLELLSEAIKSEAIKS